MAVLDLLIFGMGLALLIAGAWSLISGGTRVAAILGIPTVVVGLTVVAFGTSAPELFVSLSGAMQQASGLVLGNVIGSNVANMGLILAVAAILRPVIVEKGLPRKEVPLMLLATVAFGVMVWDGYLSRIDAGILIVGFVAFMVWTLRSGDRGDVVAPAVPELGGIPDAHRTRELARGSLLVVLGIGGLAGGGHFIVEAAVKMAQAFGISETVIGLTMVAVGTSLPELATTVVAALRNEDDLALGNIVGSNLFNILAVAGPVGVIFGLRVEGEQAPLTHLVGNPTPGQLQLVTMFLLTALVAGLIMFGRGRVGRRRGLLLLAVYGLIMWLWTN